MCKLFLNLHIQKERRKHGHQQIYLFTHFKVHTLNKAYLLLTLNVTLQLLKSPKQKAVSFSKLNSFSIGMTLSFGSFLSWLAHFGPKIALTLEITFKNSNRPFVFILGRLRNSAGHTLFFLFKSFGSSKSVLCHFCHLACEFKATCLLRTDKQQD